MNNQVLRKTFFLDKKFNNYTNQKTNWNLQALKEGLSILKTEIRQKNLEELESKLTKNDLSFYNQYENKKAEEIEVDINNLVIDALHSSLDGTHNVSGMKLVEFSEKYSMCDEVKKRTDFILQYFDFINEEFPIIVEKNNQKYDVKMGNHRVLALIKNNKEKTKALSLTQISNP